MNKTLAYGTGILVTNGPQGSAPETLALAPAEAVTITAAAQNVPPPAAKNALGVDFASRPASGAAWDRMLAASKNVGPVGLSKYDSATTAGSGQGNLLAAAFVVARNGDTSLRAKVVSICKAALAPTSGSARTLEVARNLAPIAIALNAIGEHSLDADLKRWRDYDAASQHTVKDCHRVRPNNWGTVSGQARVAVDIHLGDLADLAEAAKIHRGWLGERSVYAAFSYGTLSWQADPSHPVGINPINATKKSGTTDINIDGVLPDDQRRDHAFPTWDNQNYVWQAMGEVAATQFMLRANGYPDVFSWSDAALARAYRRYADKGYKATSDDAWQYAAAAQHGVIISHDGYAPGKSFGWVDWLYG